MPQTQTQTEELATDEDVLYFVEHVPPALLACRADRHPWTPQNVVAYTAQGKITKNLPKAAALDVTEVCPTCGCLRHHTRSFRTRDRSGYTYSNHNPQLRAPAGVLGTDVHVRSELQHQLWSQWARNGGAFPAAGGRRRSVKAA